MAISKVIYKPSPNAQGETWMDATPATAAAGDIVSPKTAMLANGVVTQGTGSGSGGIIPTGNINITQAGQTDVTNYATATVPSAIAMAGILTDFVTESNQREWRLTATVFVDPEEGGQAGWIAEGIADENTITLPAVPANTTITPSTSAQTIGGVRHMMEGPVTIAAMPSGTAGTPTATKGAVVNNSVTITPSVTNTTGYITGGTKTGTAVTVFASELVSGTLYCDDDGTWDVTNAANFVVDAGTEGTPTATKSAVSNHAVTVTPSVTNAEGWITGSTKTGTAVTVTAAELESGTKTITQAGQTDVTNYATATVPAGGVVSTVYAGLTPTISVDDDGLISVSAEEYARESVVYQAGWIDTPGEIVVYKATAGTEQLPTQSATTITPSTTAQTAVAKGKWTTGAVTVAAMPSGTTTAPTSISGTSATVSTGTNTLTLTKTVSVTPRVTTAGYVSAGTAGNSSVSLTASVTTRAAGTITPTKSTQTIPSGTYLTGTQTIAAIPAAYQDVTGVTATASDVISGKDIVNSSGTVVHGSLVVQNYYTGSSAPASNLGSNGDLYFQTTGGQ